ncbi:MAG: hypothetical protein JXQ90_03385 [Cyclobacteriaceae bacterium]
MKSLVFIILAFHFSTLSNQTQDYTATSLEGSWELISYIDHANNGKDWQQYEEYVIYQKHITPTHFTWYKYDAQSNMLLGMGGGTYSFKDNKYIEKIDFFYPPGSSELGQSIPFEVEMKDGKWMHTGHAKQMGIGEDGIKVIGSTKIEEVWSPIAPQERNKHALIGSWNLSSYRETNEGPYLSYPEFTGYMKLITPTHFVWMKYDRDGDQIFGAGGGTYSYNGNSYVENIQMAYPGDNNIQDLSITFKPSLTSHKWKHLGQIPNESNGLIDEIWVPYTIEMEDETALNY